MRVIETNVAVVTPYTASRPLATHGNRGLPTAAGINLSSRRVYRISLTTWAWLALGQQPPRKADRRHVRMIAPHRRPRNGRTGLSADPAGSGK